MQYLTYSNITMLALLVVIIGAAIRISNLRKKGKKITLSDLFTKNVVHKFEVLAIISTSSEVVSLILGAIERGIEPFSAVVRFSVMGFFELMFTFLFLRTSLSIIQGTIKYSFRDNIMRWYEWFYLIPVFAGLFLMLPLFTWPTWVIQEMYFESLGLLKLDFDVNNFPFYVTIADVEHEVLDPDTGELIRIHPEIGAMVLIWMTPALNVMQSILTCRETIISEFARVKKEKSGKKDDKKKDKKDDKNKDKDKKKDDEKKKPIDLNQAIDRLQTLFSWNAEKVKENLQKICGEHNDKSMVNPGIDKGTTSPKELKEKIRTLIVGEEGNNPQGILGYLEKKRIVEDKQEQVEKKSKELHTLRENIKKETDATKKASLEKSAKTVEDTREALRMETKKLRDAMKNIQGSLETRLKKSRLL